MVTFSIAFVSFLSLFIGITISDIKTETTVFDKRLLRIDSIAMAEIMPSIIKAEQGILPIQHSVAELTFDRPTSKWNVNPQYDYLANKQIITYKDTIVKDNDTTFVIDVCQRGDNIIVFNDTIVENNKYGGNDTTFVIDIHKCR